jgi:hypothetical protein
MSFHYKEALLHTACVIAFIACITARTTFPQLLKGLADGRKFL